MMMIRSLRCRGGWRDLALRAVLLAALALCGLPVFAQQYRADLVDVDRQGFLPGFGLRP